MIEEDSGLRLIREIAILMRDADLEFARAKSALQWAALDILGYSGGSFARVDKVDWCGPQDPKITRICEEVYGVN